MGYLGLAASKYLSEVFLRKVGRFPSALQRLPRSLFGYFPFCYQPVRCQQRPLNNPEDDLCDQELIGFLDFDIRISRVHRAQYHAPVLAQILLHDRSPIDQSDDDISRAGFLRVVNQNEGRRAGFSVPPNRWSPGSCIDFPA